MLLSHSSLLLSPWYTLIPLSLGLGFAGEIFQPLAVVIIGGIVASTSMALVIIPVLYRVFEDLRGFLARRGKKGVQPTPQPGHVPVNTSTAGPVM